MLRVKFLILSIISFVLPLLAYAVPLLPDPWAASHYGSCYRSLERGMADVYGAEYASDANIVRRDMTFGAGKIVVSEDRTTGANSARTIFEKQATGKWCVILTTPPAASLLPVMAVGFSERPLQWITRTQAAPGFPETKVIYIWNRKHALYVPTHCVYIFPEKTRNFNCLDASK